MSATSIVWRSTTPPGMEWCSLSEADRSLRGLAVLAADEGPCRIDYEVRCDDRWRTSSASVRGSIGTRGIDLRIEVARGEWILNGNPVPELAACTDIDLNFSPSTNTLPIRRLMLEVGASAPVRAAWLRFPSFRLEPFDQVYTRLSEEMYRYQSSSGFARDIRVHRSGLVTEYGEFWSAEALLEDS